MMALARTLLPHLLLALGLTACTADGSTADTPQVMQQNPDPNEAATPLSSDKPGALPSFDPDYDPAEHVTELKGTYYWGEGVETFVPCGVDRGYWVFLNTEAEWEEMTSTHDALTTKPYEGIYVELTGALGPRLHYSVVGEYAAGEDGHVAVESINLMRSSREDDCKS